jgi:hypothetical protein
MEQRIFIKIASESGLNDIETHQKLVDRFGQDALSYRTMMYWPCEFHDGKPDAQDISRPGRPPDFVIRFRIEHAFAEF